MRNCGFCDTQVSDRATVCPGCHAEYGYCGSNRIVGRQSVINRMIILAVLGVGPILIFGPELLTEIWVGFFALFILASYMHLSGGPRWYR